MARHRGARRRGAAALALLACLAGQAGFLLPIKVARRAAAEGGGEGTARMERRGALIDAVARFREVEATAGSASVQDFGVKGGELDKKSRAPRNLAASGAYYRVSKELGEAAEAVFKAADALAEENPNPKALENFGRSADCPLDGTWRLLFTTAADASFSRNTSRGGANVSNVVDAARGRVTNCIDFLPKEDGSLPPAEWLRVRLSAEAEGPLRLALTFRSVKARVTKFFGIPLGKRRLTLTFPVPGPLLTRIITFFTRKEPPKPYFDLLYLDDELRVHRTGEGNLFVQQREGSRLLEPL